MNELVNLVSQKTGIAPEVAQQAVQVVLGYLKDKLPAPIAAQISAVLGGSGGAGDVMKGLGGILGKK